MVRHADLSVKQTVTVETRRIDAYVKEQVPAARRVALWIDVEGVEYAVLQGMEGIRDKVVAVHVETAREPLRQGQHTYAEISRLLGSLGFDACGTNMTGKSTWGDVVFIQREAARTLGAGLWLCRLKAWAGVWLRADHLAVFLKRRMPGLYRVLRRAYIRLGT
jgi:hypothetical protein